MENDMGRNWEAYKTWKLYSDHIIGEKTGFNKRKNHIEITGDMMQCIRSDTGHAEDSIFPQHPY